jgi:hypothetical protein
MAAASDRHSARVRGGSNSWQRPSAARTRPGRLDGSRYRQRIRNGPAGSGEGEGHPLQALRSGVAMPTT